MAILCYYAVWAKPVRSKDYGGYQEPWFDTGIRADTLEVAKARWVARKLDWHAVDYRLTPVGE